MKPTSKLTSSVDISLKVKQNDENHPSSLNCKNPVPGTTHGSHADTPGPSICMVPDGESNLELDGVKTEAKTQPTLEYKDEKSRPVPENEGLKSKEIVSSPRKILSATQPIYSKPGSASGKENCFIEANLRDRTCKNQRLVFGVKAFGGCKNCKRVRKNMSYELAMTKKKASEKRQKLEKKIEELQKNQNVGNQNFAQEMCRIFKEERDALKKENLNLLSKLKKVQEVLMM